MGRSACAWRPSAAREGVEIVENCAVRALDIAGGPRGRCDHRSGTASRAVRWSWQVVRGRALFLRNHGVDIPQLSVRDTVAATEPLPRSITGAAADNEVAFRRARRWRLYAGAGGLHRNCSSGRMRSAAFPNTWHS